MDKHMFLDSSVRSLPDCFYCTSPAYKTCSHVPRDLERAEYVWIRHDARRVHLIAPAKTMMKFFPMNICDQEQFPGVVDCSPTREVCIFHQTPSSHDRYFLRSPFPKFWICLRGEYMVPKASKQGGSMYHPHKGAPLLHGHVTGGHVGRRVYNEDGPGQR
ncbi:hypothetical protein GWK47_002456 [Chionoecetes opilio]|uniref:Uncharacterized protein n=1 Tax=Chionoecetes opilio TaxID=41210 RepID=A0A8J4XWU2_CHIOP|nr:hypothetical protein GWK47_002456 [Chionoecetes opilio]